MATGMLLLFLNLAALIIACFGFEIAVAALQPRWYANMAVRSMPEGIDASLFDRRTPLAVAADLRRSTGDSVFALPSRQAIAEAFGTRRPGAALPRPLAGISGVVTVLCGEVGPYQQYRSDRFGFNNPDSVWSGPTTIALVGDSFVHGNCVRPDSSIAGVLRAHGVRAVGLGVSGNGPLSLLGVLREYGSILRPRVIGWVYYEGNDLCDLDEELRDRILMSYLDSSFRQSLAASQPAIDRLLREYQNIRFDRLRDRYGSRSWDGRSMLMMSQIRQLVRAPTASREAGKAGCNDIAALRRVLTRAKDDAATLGAELMFVYLPSNRASIGDDFTPERQRAAILDVVASLRIRAVDLSPTLKPELGSNRIWTFERSHYTAEGYRLVAQAIEDALANDSAGRTSVPGATTRR